MKHRKYRSVWKHHKEESFSTSCLILSLLDGDRAEHADISIDSNVGFIQSGELSVIYSHTSNTMRQMLILELSKIVAGTLQIRFVI